jgi:SAM-dependent methyltransferase
MDRHPLALTGERTLPGLACENYWFRRHEIAYREAAAIADRRGWRTVLDAGCGEGYGAEMLAGAAQRVVGVDLDAATSAHLRRAYPRVGAVCANLVRLPLPPASVDAVVSLQVVEHQWDLGRYLGEIARVLTPGGTLLVSTPNRLTFTPHSPTPAHPAHTVEFTASELAALLTRRFDVETVGGVWHGVRLAAREAELGAPLPQRLAEAGEPDTWPAWLADLVASVTPGDFAIVWPGEIAALDDSLDLLALARRRP